MEFVFHAHSGLRYLILLVAAAAFVLCLLHQSRKRPWGRPGSTFLKTLVGLVDLQVVLGLILFLGGRRPAGIVGHVVLMVAAAAVLHLTAFRQRRQPEAAGYGVPLLGVVLAIALIVLGILAVGRTVV